MQMEQAFMANNSKVLQNIPSGGGIGNLVTRLLGCWHKEMSRVSNKGQAYRTCLNCGHEIQCWNWEMQAGSITLGPTLGAFGR